MLAVLFIKEGPSKGRFQEVGRPLTQGLKFKADQEHVCQCWVIQVAFAFKEACLIYDGQKQKSHCSV